jgi:nitrous oxidase accessory protein NosD
MKAISLLAALAFAGAAEAADLPAGDARALDAALARAAPGDRIVLASGAYGDLVVGPRRDAGMVTIAAADASAPPVFRSIFLRDAEGVTLEGLTVLHGPSSEPLSDRAVEIRRSADIRLEGLRIASAENGAPGDDATGLIIRDSRRVTVTGSRFTDVFRGTVIYDSDDVSVEGNSFARIGSDGVAARGSRDLTVAGNLFTDFTPADPVKWHPDAIQLWSRGAPRANERIVIRGNVVLRGAGGATQGVFIKTPEIASRDILIEGNRIEQSMGQGVFVQNGANVIIRSNSLAAIAPVLHPPAIEVRAPFEKAVVEDNDAPKFRLPPGVEAKRNNTRG